MKTICLSLAAVFAVGATSSAEASQDPPKAQAASDMSGLHDFDFLVGEWRVHSRRLKDRLVGSQAWEEFDGTIRSMRMMDGLGNDGRNPHGNVDPPVKGRFVDGVGTFYADDTLRGKPIEVRFVWSHITPKTARWEQAYSGDGGKTREVNWSQQLERIK